MNIAENLQRIQDAKAYLREAINAKGGELSDNAKIDEFADAVENLPSDNPYAVNFGKDIVENNTYYMNSLQDDIDYYNEVVRTLNKGEKTEDDYLTGDLAYEFKQKIAWWPQGMKEVRLQNFASIRYVNFKSTLTAPTNCPKLIRYKGKTTIEKLGDVKNVSISSVSTDVAEDADLIIDGSSVTSMETMFNNVLVRRINLYLPNVTSAKDVLQTHPTLKEIYLDLPNLTEATFFLRGINADYIYLNIPKANKLSYVFQIAYNLKNIYVSNLRCNLNLKNISLVTHESIKYILDNCQEREDGASYTLTLNANVKTRFMAKCEEDASYAEALANATSKGLTIA